MTRWKVETQWHCTCDEHGGWAVARNERASLKLADAAREWMKAEGSEGLVESYSDGHYVFTKHFKYEGVITQCHNTAEVYCSSFLYLDGAWSSRKRLTRASYQRVAKWIGTHYFNNANQFLKRT